MVNPENLIGKTFGEAYNILGVPRILKYKNRNYNIRTGRLSATNTPDEEEPAEQIPINSLEDAIFAMDMADEFKVDGTMIDSAGAGTVEEYSEYTPSKPGFLQRLKKNHPSLHKGLVIATTILTLGLAAFAVYSVNEYYEEKAKPVPQTKITTPTFYNIWFPPAGNFLVLGSSSHDLKQDDLTIDIMKSDGQKINSYHFYSKDSSFISFSNGSDFAVQTDEGLLKSTYLDSYLIKIGSNNHNKNLSIQLKNVPKITMYDLGVVLYNWQGNFNIWAYLSPQNISGLKANITYDYKILDSYKNILFKQSELQGTLPSYEGAKEHEIVIKKNMTSFNPQQIYILDLEYELNVTDANNTSTIYAGYINNMPFNPEKTPKLNTGK